MGATWSVHAESHDEFMALQSEGAPESHMTYSSCMRVMEAAGLPFEDCFFMIPADRCAEMAETLAHAGFWQAEAVSQVCRAAVALGRSVSAA